MITYHTSHILACFALIVLLGCGCGPDRSPDVIKLELRSEYNPALKNNITFDQSGDTLYALLPVEVGFSGLIPTIDSPGESVTIDGRVIESNSTKVSFTRPFTMDVNSKSGNKRTYVVHAKYFNGLPIAIINTPKNSPMLSKEKYINGSIQIIGDESLNIVSEIKLRGRGNTSWNQPKKPLQIKFKNKVEVLGMPKSKRWLLLPNYLDKTMLRNMLAFEVSRSSQLAWTPNDQFVDLFVNGYFYGTYQLTEKVEVSKQRLDIGNDGVLIEADARDKVKSSDVLFRTKRELFNIKSPEVVRGDSSYLVIKQHMAKVEEVLFSKGFKDGEKGYAKYLDVESFVDWYIVNEISKNNDAIFHTSVFMHYRPGEKIKMGPVWDYDIAFGNISNSNFKTEGFYVLKSSWYKKLFKDPAFVAKVKERYPYFYGQKKHYLEAIDKRSKEIYASQQKNFEVWPILGLPSDGNLGHSKTDLKTYDDEVRFLKEWLSDRMDWLDQAIQQL